MCAGRCWRAGSRRRWMTASRAAPPGGRCSTCCATRTWRACSPPWCATFGGVKLGAGGLVRAYTDAVAQALLRREGADRAPGDAALRGAVCAGRPAAARARRRRGRPCWTVSARAGGDAVLQPCPRMLPPNSSRVSTRPGRGACCGSRTKNDGRTNKTGQATQSWPAPSLMLQRLLFEQAAQHPGRLFVHVECAA
jgi:hypothetical protein